MVKIYQEVLIIRSKFHSEQTSYECAQSHYGRRVTMLRKLLPENWHTSCSFFALHSLEHSAPNMSALRFDRSRIFDSKFETMSTRH